MKNTISLKKLILPVLAIAASGIILCVFLLSPKSPIPSESYELPLEADEYALTAEEKQEKYQAYIKDKVTEQIQIFSGESIDIDTVLNEEKEISGITLTVNAVNRLEEEIEIQIINSVSKTYDISPDNVNLLYQ